MIAKEENMEPYKIRMKVEYSQLKQRVDKLNSFLSRENDIDETEIDLLLQQFNHMSKYLEILRIRCEKHKVEI